MGDRRKNKARGDVQVYLQNKQTGDIMPALCDEYGHLLTVSDLSGLDQIVTELQGINQKLEDMKSEQQTHTTHLNSIELALSNNTNIDIL